MSPARRQRQLFRELTEKYGQSVAEAFFAAIEDIRSSVELQRLTAFLNAGNIEAALDALHIDPAAFNPVAEKLRETYAEGGKLGADGMPRRYPDGSALIVRFDGRNPEAEAWLQRHSSMLITRLREEQRQLAREALTEGMRRGANPRQTALEIVGRVNRVTGRREGGILGLTPQQASYVTTARLELASGEPEAMKHYLTRGRRDRRFDRAVAKALREEKPLDAETAAKAVTAYERRLLQLRGETIGRVESMTALQRSKNEAYRQAIASGKVQANTITKVWRSASDLRVRHTHQALNGEAVRFGEAFRSPSGAMMAFPMDTSMGAGIEDVANCRCDCEYRIDFFANLT